MYAIIEIAGKQYKVHHKDILYVPHLDAEIDDDVIIDRVLLLANDDDIQVGTPVLEDTTVTATVLDHVKADKVIVFKKIRRKRFKVKKGHRQDYTQIQIRLFEEVEEEPAEAVEETVDLVDDTAETVDEIAEETVETVETDDESTVDADETDEVVDEAEVPVEKTDEDVEKKTKTVSKKKAKK